jgi:hypothetical protein
MSLKAAVSFAISVSLHVSARLQLGAFPWIFFFISLGLYENLSRNSKFGSKKAQKYRTLCMKTDVRFRCCRRHEFADQGGFVQHSVFLHVCYCQWHVAEQYIGDTLLRLRCSNGYANEPECYVIRTFPILLINKRLSYEMCVSACVIYF